MVILQGVLGGLTVLLRLPQPISILHACTAQTFFCLVVSLAVWTSPFWRTSTLNRMEPAGKIPLHHVTLALCITVANIGTAEVVAIGLPVAELLNRLRSADGNALTGEPWYKAIAGLTSPSGLAA